jgi:catechol 2,3-dioxygenase-like lactoylglutathione lyase family enzyme
MAVAGERVASKLSNITIDCADPQKLSWFWADVFGYPHAEWSPEQRQGFLDQGMTEEEFTQRSIAEDPTGLGPRFFFQRVPESKVVKNRMHIDIRTFPDRRATHEEVDAEVERIIGLGATVVEKMDLRWAPSPSTTT